MSMMNVDTTLSSPRQFELDLDSKLNCRILSNLSLSFYQDDNLSIAWAGQLVFRDNSVEAEEFARYYQEQPDLSVLYNKLAGRFWLLVVDKQRNRIQLVNDPMSIQPCYYSLQNGCLYVSESLNILKTSDQLSCTLCNQAIYNYFYFHCIPAPDTIYQECNKLEPANLVSFDAKGRKTTHNCFRPHFTEQLEDQVSAQQQCLEVIDTAVRQQVNDKCGAFLSGGLDSSTVAGMLARHDGNAKTFSIGFEVPEYDETAYAKITAEHFSTQHQVLYLKPEMAANEFVKVAQYFDEPFGNSSAMAAYFCATFAKSNGIDHLLAGDGGDELFAGNSRYAKQKKFEVFHQASALLQSIPRLLFTHEPLCSLPLSKKIASYIKQADIPLPDRLETYNFIQQFGAEQMFDDNFLKQVDTEHPIQLKRKRYEECNSADPVDKMLYLDWKFTLADNDLVKVSKMCELAGVTVDFPLLDRKLIDFSCQIPASIKLPGSQLRDFYKKSCKGFLADATLEKSKHGFGLPFGVWMKENQQLKDLAMQCLQSFRARNIVKTSLIENALKAHESVHAGYYGELIWIMVILELWLQGNE